MPRPSLCAAGSIPGRTPAALVWDERGPWFPSRTASNWSLFPSALGRHDRRHHFPACGRLIVGRAARSADKRRGAPRVSRGPPQFLTPSPPLLLAQSLPRKRFFGPALLAGFHVEAMLLDFLDDVFLLHLTLKTPQGVLQGFTLLDDDFSHCISSPPIRFGLVSCGTSRQPSSCRLCPAEVTAPGTNYRMYCPLRGCTRKGRWHLLINSGLPSQGIFALSDPLSWY